MDIEMLSRNRIYFLLYYFSSRTLFVRLDVNKHRTKPRFIMFSNNVCMSSTSVHLSISIFSYSSSQCGVVGASHGEQSLQSMSSICVLHRALSLQVTDQRRNRLQQLFFRKLKVNKDEALCNVFRFTSEVWGASGKKVIPGFWRSWHIWWHLPSVLETH